MLKLLVLTALFSMMACGIFRDPVKRFNLSMAKCETGKADSCVDVGDAYNEGFGVERNEAQALVMYEKACSHKSGLGCARAGRAYAKGAGGVPDLARAAEYYHRGCREGLDEEKRVACRYYALAQFTGQGVVSNAPAAVEHFQQACATRDWASCGHLCQAYHEGRGTQRSLSMAVPICKKACKKNKEYCRGLDQVAQAYVPTEPSLSRELYDYGCQKRHGPSCFLLAKAHEQGLGGPADHKAGQKFYIKACDEGVKEACTDLSILCSSMWNQGAWTEGADCYDKVCSRGEAKSCLRLGRIYQTGKGRRVSSSRAVVAFRKACQMKDIEACNAIMELAQVRVRAGQLNAATLLHEDACNCAHPPGCAALGSDYEAGLGRRTNLRRALKFYEDACDAGMTQGCKLRNEVRLKIQ